MNFLITSILASVVALTSPDGRMKADVSARDGRVEYTLSCDGKTLIAPSEISMSLQDGTKIPSGRLRSTARRSVDNTFATPLYRKSSVHEKYNELTLDFQGSKIVMRLYDDAFAWRFVCGKRAPYRVLSEQAEFNFPADWMTYATYTHKHEDEGLEAQYCDDFENVYAHVPLSGLDRSHFITLPMMVEGPDGIKMVITESDLVSYPGLFLYPGVKENSLSGRNAPVPDKLVVGGHNNLQELVESRHDYIASCDGSARTFPWRVVCVSREDRQMADNDAVYALAGAAAPGEDFSWVKPGRVAWEWLNNWGLKGMDFTPGVNTRTYECYADFAAAHGLEYIILDEGWAVKYKNDLMEVVPELDLQHVIDYAAQRNVGVILWAGHYPFARDMENVCRHYSAMGVKGFKVDFMDRDDQLVEDFMLKAAATCAKYHMLVDFHGTHKPVGLQRRYPNIVNQEGIFGMEQMRKKGLPQYDMVTTDVIIPFVRYVAGFADYTPGLMRNASACNFRPVLTEPMSQGTRCRQLAQYVVYDAPLNMLSDSPSNYEKESDCLEFISAVPTVWDETRVLDGKVGEYIVTARRKGDTWYVGAMTSWEQRDITVDFSALCGGGYVADCYVDGCKAASIASDYRRISCSGSEPLKVHLAPGGGFAAIVSASSASDRILGKD